MDNAQFLATFGTLFLLFGAYNIYTGGKRIRRAQKQGIAMPWYKQTMLLVGIEYILLAIVCLLRLSVINNWLPQTLNILIIPAYVVVLLPSAVLAGLIVRQSIANLRQPRQSPAPVVIAESGDSRGNGQEKSQRALNQQRRDRRQKAAAARRRRAGKA